MTNQEQKIIDYAKAHQRSRDFVGVFEENIEYVKLGGYVSESGKVVYLEHTADMMKNSVLYVSIRIRGLYIIIRQSARAQREKQNKEESSGGIKI